MKCNYDDWTTKVAKSVTPKMRKVLEVMADGDCRTRASMLYAAGINPNPRSTNGFPGSEFTDYYLYRQGLLSFERIEGQQKVFKITAEGLAEVSQIGRLTGSIPA